MPAPARVLAPIACPQPAVRAESWVRDEVEPERELAPVQEPGFPELVEKDFPQAPEVEPADSRAPIVPLAIADFAKWTRGMRSLRPIARHEAPAAPIAAVQAVDDEATPVEEPRFEPARPRSCPSPSYPRAALVRGESGSVLLRIDVDAQGAVVDVHVERSSGFPRLDEAAEDAAYAWRFFPARRAGVAVADKVRHRVTFELRA